MTRYRLKITGGKGKAQARMLAFEADDAASALSIAQREVGDFAAELWNEDRALCTLRRTGTDGQVWWVGPPGA